MKRQLLLLILFMTSTVLLTACNRHESQAPSNTDDNIPILTSTQISATIDNLVKKFPENTTMGIIVQDLSNGKMLYELNPTRSFVPASVIKVLTASTALEYLGPNFRFNTVLATDKSITDKSIMGGIIAGNLYISFSGDPTLRSSQLSALLSVLAQKKVQQIKGNVIIDHAPFVKEQWGPGFMWDDENICFAALSNGIILDQNCFKFHLYPNPKLNGPAVLVSRSPLRFTPINNTVTTQLSASDDCDQTLLSLPDNHYELSGCIPYNRVEQRFNVAIREPDLYAAHFIKAILAQQHIHLNGQVMFGTRPANLTILASHQSEPLSILTQHMLKKSDNLYANTIFKTVGAVYYDGAANWKNGADAMLAILTQMHVHTSYDILVDGAGLSRYNRLTPKTLLDTFNVTYHQPNLKDIFMKSLASSGGYGTLKYFTLDQSGAKFLGKTGSMKNVKGLAGILTRGGKPALLFIMLINGSSPTKNYTKLANQILNDLCQVAYTKK